VEPRVLLLDEPFGALDAKVRKELRRWLRRLHDELHITSIFVTHDQDEALEVADRIVLMDHGRVEQVGTPQEVYERPATPFVYGFLGAVNRFVGHARGGVLHMGEHQLPGAGSHGDGVVQAYARPHELQILTDESAAGLSATVERVLSFGASARVELIGPDGQPLEAELTRAEAEALSLRGGQRVKLSAAKLSLFEAGAGI
jgi:sulfate transport system ATP-binding protein